MQAACRAVRVEKSVADYVLALVRNTRTAVGAQLGVSPRGDVVVVRWEYPGGRVADITVDGRSGRILGER